ncbi:MAG TPA: hypothetical protein PK771_07325 [Spirochaetota bacterium]|nr:hypothetical protein [Spirochaetota bacterium]
MNIRISIILLIIFLSIIQNITSTEKKVGITRIHTRLTVASNDILFQLEDIVISSFANIDNIDKSALNLKISYDDFKKKKYDKSEVENLEYLIIPEILYYSLNEEKNFYDELIIDYRAKLNLKLTLIEIEKNRIIDETQIEVDYLSKKDKEEALNKLFSNLTVKLDKYFDELTIFKAKIEIVKRDKNFLWLSRGLDANLKVGNILCYYESDQVLMKEHTLIQIVKVNNETSIANIIYTNGEIPDDAYFIIQSKTNLEIQFAGGFSLGNLNDTNISLNPNANLRFIIPVGLLFFNPIVEIEAKFFYKNAKLLLPFSFLTGVEGKFNIYRYEIATGFMAGIFFSPDLDYAYKLDSGVIKPYIRNSAILTSVFRLFFEFGYKHYFNDNFNKDWKIDLKGVYFLFGFSVYL